MGCDEVILLDTHVLIWAFENDPHLGRKAAKSIEAATKASEAGFAAITVWEIALLTEKGRLALSRDVEHWIGAALDFDGLRLMELLPAIAIGSNRLPGSFHADPADRMIVATARHHDMTLLTADAAILRYAAAGHIRAVDAAL